MLSSSLYLQFNQYLPFFIGHHELPSPTKLPAVVKDASKFPNNMANDNMKSQASTKKKSDTTKDAPPSVEKILRQAKKEANRNPQDWQKEYEERKKAAMEAMKSKKSVQIGGLSAFHKK